MATVKMFYKNAIYKQFSYCSRKQATDWMKSETNLIPYEKRYLVYFEIRSMQKRHEIEQKLTNLKNTIHDSIRKII